jgi:phosphoribosylglycinamide formyltransferase-1
MTDHLRKGNGKRAMPKRIAIGILVSGSGSNLQSIIDHIEAGTLAADIKIVISNNPDAYSLERCRQHHIPCVVVDHHHFGSREEYDGRLIEILKASDVELVVLAGFMRILTPGFFQAFPLRVMNIHPALLPSFPGVHSQQAAVDYGVKFSGCTVHFADEGVDSGPIIIQAVVPVHEDDTAETLGARILQEEHRIYPQAIQYYSEGKIEVDGRKVRIRSGPPVPDGALHNPPLASCS